MAATATVTIPDNRYSFAEGTKYRVIGTVALSATGNYVAGGVPCSLFVPLVKASRTPILVYVQGQAGYIYVYVPGADASLGVLKILVQGAAATDPLAEISSAAVIPTGAVNDTITIDALFQGME